MKIMLLIATDGVRPLQLLESFEALCNENLVNDVKFECINRKEINI